MGWVSRPCDSSSKSLQASSAATVWWSKNSGVARLVVISQAVAFAPFSQNSNKCGSAGLAHEQLTHAKPSGLFCLNNTRVPFTATCSCRSIDETALTEPQPPAGWSYCLMRGCLLMAVRSAGELARTTRMRSRAEFIQQKTDWMHEHKFETGRPANAGRRLSDLFTPGFPPGKWRRFAKLFVSPFAAAYAAFMQRKARRSSVCRFQTFGLRFECIGTTTNFFRFHGHERSVVGGEGVLIRHAFRHAMQQRAQFTLSGLFDGFVVVEPQREFCALVQQEQARREHRHADHFLGTETEVVGDGRERQHGDGDYAHDSQRDGRIEEKLRAADDAVVFRLELPGGSRNERRVALFLSTLLEC